MGEGSGLLAAIRAKCLDCSGNMRREVERCRVKDCPLYPYRAAKATGSSKERPENIRGQISVFEALEEKNTWLTGQSRSG